MYDTGRINQQAAWTSSFSWSRQAQMQGHPSFETVCPDALDQQSVAGHSASNAPGRGDTSAEVVTTDSYARSEEPDFQPHGHRFSGCHYGARSMSWYAAPAPRYCQRPNDPLRAGQRPFSPGGYCPRPQDPVKPATPPPPARPEPVPATPPPSARPEPVPATPPPSARPEPVPATPPPSARPEPVPATPPPSARPEPAPAPPPPSARPEPAPLSPANYTSDMLIRAGQTSTPTPYLMTNSLGFAPQTNVPALVTNPSIAPAVRNGVSPIYNSMVQGTGVFRVGG